MYELLIKFYFNKMILRQKITDNKILQQLRPFSQRTQAKKRCVKMFAIFQSGWKKGHTGAIYFCSHIAESAQYRRMYQYRQKTFGDIGPPPVANFFISQEYWNFKFELFSSACRFLAKVSVLKNSNKALIIKISEVIYGQFTLFTG